MENKIEWNKIEHLFFDVFESDDKSAITFEIYERHKGGMPLLPRYQMIIFRNDFKIGSLEYSNLQNLKLAAESMRSALSTEFSTNEEE